MGMKGLEGKVAIVTGSAGAGNGQGTVRSLLDNGAWPVVTDVHERRTREIAEALSTEYGTKVLGIPLDVSEPDQAEAAVQQVLEHYGRLDILVNNAGINSLAPVWEMDDQTWHKVMAICLHGTFYCTRAALKPMIRQGSGAIINISSVAAWINSDEGESHYCASKAGVMGFTRAVAAEVAGKGIRVNCIAPGFIYNDFLGKIYPQESLQELSQGNPMRRAGEPQEIGDVACFLACDESRYITGQTLPVDGGMYMR